MPPSLTTNAPAEPQPGTVVQWGHERLSTLLTPGGTGHLLVGHEAVTRWRRDPTADQDGLFLYLRDLRSGDAWSASWQPIPPVDETSTYEVGLDAEAVEFERFQYGIRSRWSVRVAADVPVEFRTLWLANESSAERVIEVTTFAELVLQAATAFESHPVFSKLFLETEWDSDYSLLVAPTTITGARRTNIESSSLDRESTWRNDLPPRVGKRPLPVRRACTIAGATPRLDLVTAFIGDDRRSSRPHLVIANHRCVTTARLRSDRVCRGGNSQRRRITRVGRFRALSGTRSAVGHPRVHCRKPAGAFAE